MGDSLYNAAIDRYSARRNSGEPYALMARAAEVYAREGADAARLHALYYMAFFKRTSNDYAAAIALSRQTYALADSLDSKLYRLKARIEERRNCREIGDYMQVMRLAPVIDSLLQYVDDPTLRITCNTEQSDDAMTLGAYPLAEALLRRNDALINALPTEKVGELRILYLSKLRDILVNMGRYDEALDASRRYIQMWTAKMGPTHPYAYLPYVRHADIYRAKGDSAQAFAMLDTMACRIDWERAPATLAFVCYWSQNDVRKHFHRYDEALYYLDKADSVVQRNFEEGSIYWNQVKACRGDLLLKLDRYAEAETLMRGYAKSVLAHEGEQSETYRIALFYLAAAEAYNGHIEDGCAHYAQAARLTIRQVKEQLRYVPTSGRATYWQEAYEKLGPMTPYALRGEVKDPAFLTACYDALLFSKALLLDSDRSMQAVIDEDGDERSTALYAEVMSLRARLANPQPGEPADSLYARLHEADLQLLALSTQYRDYTSFLSATYDDIRQALGPGEALVDFTDYISKDGSRHYAAYLITPRQQAPELFPLFTEADLDSLAEGYGVEFLHTQGVAPSVCHLLWDSLATRIPEGSHVYYVPSGTLHQMALENLTVENDQLLGERYAFTRLTSARQVLHLTPDVAHEKATLYGGLRYNLKPEQWTAETRDYEVSPLLAMRGASLRGDTVFNDLPASRREVNDVNRILKKRGVETDLFTEARGTEESFLNLNGHAPAILLASTHGFYFTPDEAAGLNYLRNFTDAMSLSGLVMAGGNAAWSGQQIPEGTLPGILTAQTIARMNLRGLDLAVLSACQSGRGKITPDGVYGLQRAFKKAGAQTLLMTLWKVSDFAAERFITTFFHTLAQNGWQKRQAFDKAREAVRKKYPEPYYWAGFVMVD